MKIVTLIASIFLSLAGMNSAEAIDSYRYLHVSIQTPWHIFLFLLIGVLAPFVVMAWLYWRHAKRPDHIERKD